MGDEFTAAALTDALFDGKDPAPAETIQRAINRVLEPGISNDGLLGEQTFAAYRTLAKDSATRNQLLDALADERERYRGQMDERVPHFCFRDVRDGDNEDELDRRMLGRPKIVVNAVTLWNRLKKIAG